jgi:L-asparaginase II
MHAAGWRELGGDRPTPLWNNCSGKHAGMLACCRHRGWPTLDYRRPDHPLQAQIREVVRIVTGEASEAIGEGVDGCGIPVFHLSLAGMATAYARLAAPESLPPPWDEAARRILAALLAQPFFLAGTDRLCTRMLEVTQGRAVVKVGAAGVFCAALPGRGLGVALKVEDGSSHAAGVALVESVRQLGAIGERELPDLAGFGPGRLRNHAGAHVGEVVARLRLDG